MALSAEKKRQNERNYYDSNREKVLERRKAYYEANKEKILERNKLYRKTDKGKLEHAKAEKSRYHREGIDDIFYKSYKNNSAKKLEYKVVSAETAINNGKKITQEEIDFILSSDKKTVEIAIELGRTYNSINSIKQKYRNKN